MTSMSKQMKDDWSEESKIKHPDSHGVRKAS
jgi:hypothetical protein